MSKWKKLFRRSSQNTVDGGAVGNDLYNEAAGASKVMIVEPDIKSTYAANTPIGSGKLIKITTGGIYSLVMLGKAYNSGLTYKKGNVVVQATFVYVCDIPESEIATGTFDTEKWSKVAPATIAGIPNAAGDVVSTGRWHNAISVVGFVVEDESEIKLTRV